MAKIAGTKEIDGKNVVIEFDVTLKSFKGNFDIYVDWSKFNWWHPLEKTYGMRLLQEPQS
jgi:hypothetical protein